MMIDGLFRLKEQMNDEGIIFCFSGYMTEQILTGIATSLKHKMEQEKVSITTSKSVFSMVVELSQNIIRYSAEKSQEGLDEDIFRYGILAVGSQDETYYVSCGNLIETDKADQLVKNLDHIKTLDRKQVKKLYKNTLRNGLPEGSKGAGVGFMEIALRASGGVEYDLKPIASDQDHVFFAIKARISNKVACDG